MILTFIGTASGLSVLDRSHASILLQNGEQNLLLDCGEGTVRSLLSLELDPRKIGSIFISHTHPDHCAGIPIFMQYCHLTGREGDLELFLPQGTGESFKKYFRQLYLLNEKLTFDYTLCEYSAGKLVEDEKFFLEAIPNRHLSALRDYADTFGISIASCSFVVREGASVVYYSADLMDTGDLDPPDQTDVMIVESTHITVENALKIARKKGIPKIVFTHIPPELEICDEVRGGVEIRFASEGMKIEV